MPVISHTKQYKIKSCLLLIKIFVQYIFVLLCRFCRSYICPYCMNLLRRNIYIT